MIILYQDLQSNSKSINNFHKASARFCPAPLEFKSSSTFLFVWRLVFPTLYEQSGEILIQSNSTHVRRIVIVNYKISSSYCQKKMKSP